MAIYEIILEESKLIINFALDSKVDIEGIARIVLGSGSTILMGMNTANNCDIPGEESKDITVSSESRKPSWAVGDIDVTSSVNDNMKFGEAFAAASAGSTSNGYKYSQNP